MKAIIFLALLFSFPAIAERTCLDKTEAKMLESRFTIKLDQEPDFCSPTNRHYIILEALIFIHYFNMAETKPVDAPYDQHILPEDWINNLLKIAPNILNGSADSNCTNSYAFAGPAPERTLNMYVCPMLFKDSDEKSVLNVVSTLLHESRHLEGNGYFHSTCKGGRKGSQGCDASATMKGAYAVEMESLAKIARNEGVHPALRFYAKRLAEVTARERFVVSPFDTEKDENATPTDPEMGD